MDVHFELLQFKENIKQFGEEAIHNVHNFASAVTI